MPFIHSILGHEENLSSQQETDSQNSLQGTEEVEPSKSFVDTERINTLALASQALLTSTTEGLSGIEELKVTMESIAAAAEESAGASEESLGAVNSIKQNSSAILKLSTDSVSNIKELERSINNAAGKINDSSENMRRIATSAQHVGEVGERLHKAGEEVSQTVNLITKLAKRTSLLALNAAIEASRAEENGRGFSVIAKEIRSLSAKSNNYAQEITTVVSDLQSNVKHVQETIINTKNSIENSSTTADTNALSMKDLIQNLITIVNDVTQSLEEFKELDNDIIKMQLSSETIASAAEEAAGAVSEVTQTISMQATAFNQANSAAKMLDAMAEKLEHSVDQSSLVSDIASAAEELSSAIEEIENSMAQSMVALSQIEEAANISQDDAGKNIDFAQKANEIATKVKQNISNINENLVQISQNFALSVEAIEQAGVDSKANLKQSEDILHEAKQMKKKIKHLKKTLRKIELTIVQTASLSINGAVEAMQVKNADSHSSEGFSVVSNDIRALAQNSEQSLDKVNDIVDNLEDETEEIIEAIDKMQTLGVKEADELIILSSDMKNNTDEIAKTLKVFEDVQNKIDTIEHALSEAKLGAEQIATAADLALSNAQESEKAAQHITSVSEKMAENVTSLIEVAALLEGK